MSQDLREVILWALGLTGSMLLAVVAFFLKRMIDQLDARGKAQHKLREDFQQLRSSVDLDMANLRSALRLGFERMRIKYHDIQGLSDPPRAKDDSTETNRIS
jgi:hypothetical protein